MYTTVRRYLTFATGQERHFRAEPAMSFMPNNGSRSGYTSATSNNDRNSASSSESQWFTGAGEQDRGASSDPSGLARDPGQDTHPPVRTFGTAQESAPFGLTLVCDNRIATGLHSRDERRG
jgi:hypothetical protein